MLLESLVLVARRRGIKTLTAVTLWGNTGMLEVFRMVGLAERTFVDEDAVVHVAFDLQTPDELDERSAERHLVAAQAASQSGSSR